MGIFRRTPDVLHDLLDERAMLIDAQGTELIKLNHLGTVVWRALDGRRDSDSIAHEVTQSFENVDPQRITADVEAFLDQLHRLRLVQAVTRQAEEPDGPHVRE